MVKFTLTCREIIYSGYAVRRMFEKDLRPEEVRAVIEEGEIIAFYPDDQPFASYLLLGWSRDRPLHVVLAVDNKNGRCYVMTAYIPDLALWRSDFKSRR